MRRTLSAFSYDLFSYNLYLRIVIFVAAFSLVIFSLIAPIRQSVMGFPNGEFVYRTLSFICHQLPSRSFWVFGFPCGLCSRCLLGYAGVAVAALFISHPCKYTKRFLLGTAFLVPGVADVLIQIATNYESANLTRAITGLTGGIGLFMVLYPLGFQNPLKRSSL